MTVKELREKLAQYPDDADVKVVDWSTGREFDFSVGADDDAERNICSIGLD